MFLRITRRKYKSTEYMQAMIIETYRDGCKIRQRVLKNIGAVKTEGDIAKAKRFLEDMKHGRTLVSLDEIIFDTVKEYGVIYAAKKLWDRLGLKKAIGDMLIKRKIRFNAFDAFFLLSVSRLYAPSSDLEAYDWIKNKAHYRDNIQLQHLYRTLDFIVDEKKDIEKKIFELLKETVKLKADLVFYDLTTAYFEGNGPASARYGYSRDHRPDKKQVVIGLVLCDGFPITHRMWPGNTLDRATLKEAVSELKQTFEIGKTIFVADRGLILEANLEALESAEYDYIIATRRRRDNFAEALLKQDISDSGAKVVKEDGKRRYILCFNKETQESERKKLAEAINERTKRLEEIKSTISGRKSKMSDRKVYKLVSLKLKSYVKFFTWSFSRGEFKYSINQKVLEYENSITGKFLLVTTTDHEPEEIMKSYKDLKYIEQMFREMKDIIDLRPINHRTDRRVEGHVFVCVLSILTRRLMSRSLSETNSMIETLSKIKIAESNVGGEKYYFLTKLTPKQEETFMKLGIEMPTRYNIL